MGLIISVILAFRNYLYLSKIKEGKYRYTVGVIRGNENRGQASGKSIEYCLNGNTYEGFCSSPFCKRTKVGETYFLRVFLEDPNVFDVIEYRWMRE